MKMYKVFNFWNSLQSRERVAMKILLVIVAAASIVLFFTKVVGAISTNKYILLTKKNEFDYVLLRAEKIQAFVTSQQLGLNSKNPREFLISESNAFGLVNFRLTAQEDQNIVYFSVSSIVNMSNFLNKIALHPSLTIASILITPGSDEFAVKVIITLI